MQFAHSCKDYDPNPDSDEEQDQRWIISIQVHFINSSWVPNGNRASNYFFNPTNFEMHQKCIETGDTEQAFSHEAAEFIFPSAPKS